MLGGYRSEAATDERLLALITAVKRRLGEVVADLDHDAADEAQEFVDALLDREPNQIGAPLRAELAALAAKVMASSQWS